MSSRIINEVRGHLFYIFSTKPPAGYWGKRRRPRGAAAAHEVADVGRRSLASLVCRLAAGGYHPAGSEASTMARSSAVRALAPLAMLVAAGCQDYNFNPVGHCLVQPGQRARHALGSLVGRHPVRGRRLRVDGGGAGEARGELRQVRRQPRSDQRGRAAAGLSPIDFHIAVTTTSVFWNYGPFPDAGDTCAPDCAGNAGRLAAGRRGRYPDAEPGRRRPHQRPRRRRVRELEHKYDFAFCCCARSLAGVAVDGAPYPQGDFVSWDGEPARPPLRQGAVRGGGEEPPGLHARRAHRLLRGRRRSAERACRGT